MPKSGAGIEYQERDLLLLEDLFVSRLMTLAHAAALHFDGKGEAAKKRVHKLKLAGLVGERPRKAREPGVLFLAKQGFELLHAHGRLSAYPPLSWQSFEKRARVSDFTLRHELAVMDAKAALAPAITKRADTSLIEFTTWPMLCQFTVPPPGRGSAEVCVKPDGFIRVEETTTDGTVYEHAFFLEVDRGTETLHTLAFRAICYREHYSSGGYAVARGAAATAYAEYPFRVLMVFPSDERRNNVAEALLQITPAIETQVWLGTSGDVAADPLGAIWARPRDYRSATEGTEYEVSPGWKAATYRRRPEREALVRGRVSTHSLFEA
jgi:hypothetical protein